jgi:putative membrane-bound dehydrogenase-like protein
MAWDERGRLWIAETVDYPNNLQPPGKGNDRITICEDTKGTGRADKFTVFADKLSIPTGLTFANGGAIVTQAPDTLFLKSSKGDDRADVREVLFSGWHTNDTHAGPSNLRRGLDNWIWGTVGYAGFRGKIGDRDYRFSQGVYRFKPDGSQLEFLTSTSNNTWGLGLSETGDVFASTANNQHSVHLALPNRAFVTAQTEGDECEPERHLVSIAAGRAAVPVPMSGKYTGPAVAKGGQRHAAQDGGGSGGAGYAVG